MGPGLDAAAGGGMDFKNFMSLQQPKAAKGPSMVPAQSTKDWKRQSILVVAEQQALANSGHQRAPGDHSQIRGPRGSDKGGRAYSSFPAKS